MGLCVWPLPPPQSFLAEHVITVALTPATRDTPPTIPLSNTRPLEGGGSADQGCGSYALPGSAYRNHTIDLGFGWEVLDYNRLWWIYVEYVVLDLYRIWIYAEYDILNLCGIGHSGFMKNRTFWIYVE